MIVRLYFIYEYFYYTFKFFFYMIYNYIENLKVVQRYYFKVCKEEFIYKFDQYNIDFYDQHNLIFTILTI